MKYYEDLHGNNFDKVNEIDKLIEKLKLSKLPQKKRQSE